MIEFWLFHWLRGLFMSNGGELAALSYRNTFPLNRFMIRRPWQEHAKIPYRIARPVVFSVPPSIIPDTAQPTVSIH